MIKYFCDICNKEVEQETDLDTIKICGLVKENSRIVTVYYQTCSTCRTNINDHILKIQKEERNE